MRASRTSILLKTTSSAGTQFSRLVSASSEEEIRRELDWITRVEEKRRRREKDSDLRERILNSGLRDSGIITAYGKLTPDLLKKILIILANNNVSLKASLEETITPLQLRQIIKQSKEDKKRIQYRNSQHMQVYQQIEEYHRKWEKKMIKKMIERVAIEIEIPRRNIVRKSALFMSTFKENPYSSLEYDEEYVKSVLKKLGIPESELPFFKKLAVNLDGLADLVEDFIGDYKPFRQSIKRVTFVDLTEDNKSEHVPKDVNNEEEPLPPPPPKDEPDEQKKAKKRAISKMLKDTTPRNSLLKGALNLLMGELYDPKQVIKPHEPTEEDLEKLSGTRKLNITGRLMKKVLEKDRLKSMRESVPYTPKLPYPNEWFMTRSQKMKKAYYRKLLEPVKIESKYAVVEGTPVLPRDVIVDVLSDQKTLLERNTADKNFVEALENAEPIKLKHLGWTTPKSRGGPTKVYTTTKGRFKRVIDSYEELYKRKLTLSEYRAKYHISVPLHFIPAGSAPRWKKNIRRPIKYTY